MTEFGVVTQVGISIFLGVNHVPIPMGRGPSVPTAVTKLQGEPLTGGVKYMRVGKIHG